ncbi:rna-directed dna polymerase from mobile element jockey-like [Willisornis vidua]|uniref:Rna-directed dna polymerase from mobile element jockey-like n=1 Tax=Willisornis vidua TaxID=1566151 RepID=A0ABQ9CYD3_9PASS|nr:rna-directed dna polymerase from mobile element jockey-like [Willisornis vidua]
MFPCATSRPVSIIYQQSWLTREVLVNWRSANMMPIYKKGQNENLGIYRPVSLTWVLSKVMEKIILSTIMWHIQDNQEIRPSQHGFVKGRSCLANPIFFYDKVLSTWTLTKPLTLFPTVFFWRNWPVAWASVLFAELKTGWMVGPRITFN